MLCSRAICDSRGIYASNLYLLGIKASFFMMKTKDRKVLKVMCDILWLSGDNHNTWTMQIASILNIRISKTCKVGVRLR